MKLPHWLGHDWDKWEQFTVQGTMVGGLLIPKELWGKEFNEQRQSRKCATCDKIQVERIRP